MEDFAFFNLLQIHTRDLTLKDSVFHQQSLEPSNPQEEAHWMTNLKPVIYMTGRQANTSSAQSLL